MKGDEWAREYRARKRAYVEAMLDRMYHAEDRDCHYCAAFPYTGRVANSALLGRGGPKGAFRASPPNTRPYRRTLKRPKDPKGTFRDPLSPSTILPPLHPP